MQHGVWFVFLRSDHGASVTWCDLFRWMDQTIVAGIARCHMRFTESDMGI